MATAEGNWFEIERRNIMFKPTTTLPDGSSLGYDEDPNNVIDGNTDGETLLYNCPQATMYCESSGVIWFKESTPNTWVVIGSSTSSINYEKYIKTIDSTDESNQYIDLPHTPTTNSEIVFLNGIAQTSGSSYDYTISGIRITFITSIISGDILMVNYVR